MHRRTWLSAAGLVGIAAGAGVLVGQSAATAAASTPVTFSREQLVINQRISQAAVRRSNESLGLLDAIRPVAGQPAKVLGWPTQSIRDGAITGSKLADRSVSADKLAPGTAGAPTTVRAFKLAGPVAVPAEKTRVVHLDLPAGSWAVLAKGYATTNGSQRSMTCTLTAGADTDTGLAAIQKDAPASMALQVAQVFTSPGAAELSCSAPAEGGVASALNAIRLTAIQADALTVTVPQS